MSSRFDLDILFSFDRLSRNSMLILDSISFYKFGKDRYLSILYTCCVVLNVEFHRMDVKSRKFLKDIVINIRAGLAKHALNCFDQ